MNQSPKLPHWCDDITSNDFCEGPDEALITLVHYGDYTAPRCREYWPMIAETRRWLRGEIRYAFRYVAAMASTQTAVIATALHAAAQQTKHWALHDALFAHAEDWSESTLDFCAQQAGLDHARFHRDCQNPALQALAQTKLIEDQRTAWRCDATRPPVFFISGYRYEGALDLESLVEALLNAHPENDSH